jgi:hypothetical protein
MSSTDPGPTGPQKDIAMAAAEASLSQAKEGLGKIVESITPWLVELGAWIFAGLIASLLIILASLLTVGPVDRAITIATIACAIALPLELAGLVLLRLAQDTARIDLAGTWVRAFHDAGFPIGERPTSPQARAAQREMSMRAVLLCSFGILALSVLLTLIGLSAALWHMAWWIAVIFIAMAIISLGIVIAALVTVGPPESPEQKERYRQYWDELMKRASERSTKGNENTSPGVHSAPSLPKG